MAVTSRNSLTGEQRAQWLIIALSLLICCMPPAWCLWRIGTSKTGFSFQIGDRSDSVTVVNRSSETLRIYFFDGDFSETRPRASFQAELAPNQQTTYDFGFWSSNQPVSIAARNPAGDLFFCQTLNYDALDALHWQVDIDGPKNVCA